MFRRVGYDAQLEWRPRGRELFHEGDPDFRMVMPDKLVLWEKAGFAMRRTYKGDRSFQEASCQAVVWDKWMLVARWEKDGRRKLRGRFP